MLFRFISIILFILIGIAALQSEPSNNVVQGPINESNVSSPILNLSAGISVTQTLKTAPSGDNFTKVTYAIKVKNSGYIKLEKINLTDLLPKNVTFESITYADNTSSPIELERTTEDNRQKIRWNIGDLDIGNVPKTIVIEAIYMTDDAKVTSASLRKNEVLVEALALGQNVLPAITNLTQVSTK